MKIRNKKTGGIIEFNVIDGQIVVNSLKQLNEEWEDYEEPKAYWYIDYNGTIKCFQYLDFDWQEEMQAIGNYFETKEEAEKAVEKLKAWKRLKDYYVKFKLDFVRNTIHFTYRIDDTLHSAVNEERIIFEDMKTIFGGEE